eukprot:5874227-Alexandrium_andersonii.AAC.1
MCIRDSSKPPRRPPLTATHSKLVRTTRKFRRAAVPARKRGNALPDERSETSIAHRSPAKAHPPEV